MSKLLSGVFALIYADSAIHPMWIRLILSSCALEKEAKLVFSVDPIMAELIHPTSISLSHSLHCRKEARELKVLEIRGVKQLYHSSHWVLTTKRRRKVEKEEAVKSRELIKKWLISESVLFHRAGAEQRRNLSKRQSSSTTRTETNLSALSAN